MIYPFCATKNDKVKLLSVISVAVVATSFLFISPTMSSIFASTIQSPLTAMYNQVVTKNNAGVIILEGAMKQTLPKPNGTNSH
jgi:hypothetical protein